MHVNELMRMMMRHRAAAIAELEKCGAIQTENGNPTSWEGEQLVARYVQSMMLYKLWEMMLYRGE